MNETTNELKYRAGMKRYQTLGEEIGNAITHGVGSLLAVFALVIMYIKCDSTRDYISITIYGFCMIMLYTMSCLYHSFKNGSKVKYVFRIFDHLSIFLLIGGTYAPVLLIGLNNSVGLTFFIIQWTIILLAVVGKIFIKFKTTLIHTILCCLLGWSGIFILPFVYQIDVVFFWLILAGGIGYMAGIFFYAAKFKYAHFVWHFFVILGTVLQFIAIYLYLL